MFFPEAQPTFDPSNTQQRDCSPWVRVTTGRNTESTVFPTDESMYGALTRVARGSSSHLVAGNARQVHRKDMPDDFV
jgi:hypothetical protein